MGFDLDARIPSENKEIILSDFAKMHKYCIKIAGSVDAGLEHGSLGCRSSVFAAQFAIYKDLSDEDNVHDWNVSKIEWNWDFKWDDVWAYHSAKLFIEVCLKHNLIIHFSY